MNWRFDNNIIEFATIGVSFIRIKYWITFICFFVQRWLVFLLRLFSWNDYKKKKQLNKPVYDASFLFFLAMLKITPVLILKPIYIGSVLYEMPFPVNYWKRISYGCRWVINLIKKKQRVISVETVVEALSNSLWDDGVSMEKKDDVYSLAVLNRHLLRNRVMRR